MKLLVMYSSSRRHANSEILAERVIQDLPATRLFLTDHQILPIEDMRHTEEGFGFVDDDYDQIIHQVLDHEILLFSAPIYWYGMPARMKLFFDRWSQSLRDQRFAFKSEMSKKRAYVVLTGGDAPRLKGLPLIQQFQYIFDFVGMEFAGFLIGDGNRPGEILSDQRALLEASALNAALRQQLGGVGMVRQVGSLATEAGQALPAIRLPATTGELVNLQEAAQHQHLVLFGYPGDREGLRYPELAGCTAEACSFRDRIGAFREQGALLFGMSLQSSERQRLFVEREHLPFAMLSDAQEELTRALGLPIWVSEQGERYLARTTVVVAKGGRVAQLFPDVQVEGHIAEVLACLEGLNRE